MLLQTDPGLHVVGVASEIDPVVAHLSFECSDLLVLDWDGMGSETGELRDTLATVARPPLIIGMSVQRENRQAALADGASAFVCKGDPPECLRAVIRETGSPLQR